MTAGDEALPARIAATAAALPDTSDPRDTAGLLAVLRLVYATGRRDLPLARLVEGHVDALQIVRRLAGTEVVAATLRAVAGGATFGVWNAALPGDPLRIDGDVVTGGKSYASGAGLLSHALATADTADGAQLLLIDLAASPPAIDRDWWNTIGMARSHTHRVRWDRVAASRMTPIGGPGAYAAEPWFSGGALRFVAAHAGGVAGVFDRVRDHLVERGRADDPFQRARLARLHDLAALSAAAVRVVANDWFDQADAVRLPRVAAARLQVADLATEAITLAQEAVGLEGMFAAHPLSAHVTDLMVYLRQPAPDAQRQRVGRAAADGVLVPDL